MQPDSASQGPLRWVATTVLPLFLLASEPAMAASHDPFAARSGLEVAHVGARAWSLDAVLVYVENDEEIDPQGAAPRWGYLFYSPRLEKARSYSIRGGKILVAEDLEMKFEAPPVAAPWIDSGAALALAEQEAGREFRRKHRAELTTMLLMRGAFHAGDPDQTTWTLIYTSPDAPSLFVVIDAVEGKVRRTWRG